MCKWTDSNGSLLGDQGMIPTSARRRIVIKMLIDYSTGWVAPRRRIERRLLLNLLPRPLLILWVQSDLALVHCPSINRNNLEGETNKQTNKWGQHMQRHRCRASVE